VLAASNYFLTDNGAFKFREDRLNLQVDQNPGQNHSSQDYFLETASLEGYRAKALINCLFSHDKLI